MSYKAQRFCTYTYCRKPYIVTQRDAPLWAPCPACRKAERLSWAKRDTEAEDLFPESTMEREDLQRELSDHSHSDWRTIEAQHNLLCHSDGSTCKDGCDAAPIWCQCPAQSSPHLEYGWPVCLHCNRAIEG